jgi:hypothetical protein
MGHLILGKFAREHLHYSTLPLVENTQKPYSDVWPAPEKPFLVRTLICRIFHALLKKTSEMVKKTIQRGPRIRPSRTRTLWCQGNPLNEG